MNFTREPIIETVITPREGCKLVIKSSKCVGQEEYYVDAIEVVSFGQALFFRSSERPKSFLVPVTDYEVIETRETRMILKAAPTDKGIKIGGGREVSSKNKGHQQDKEESSSLIDEFDDSDLEFNQAETAEQAATADTRFDKKRDRRKNRRRKTRVDEKEEAPTPDAPEGLVLDDMGESYQEEAPSENALFGTPIKRVVETHASLPSFPTLLPPPTTLISETISMYKGNAEYRKAFFDEEKEEPKVEETSHVDTELHNDEMPFPPSFPDD
ncbi:MAG: hypothetical protein P4L16_02860 [Chlamydiales bacterium]|nr:hypothetical protein [Chlamydiales bacterium]